MWSQLVAKLLDMEQRYPHLFKSVGTYLDSLWITWVLDEHYLFQVLGLFLTAEIEDFVQHKGGHEVFGESQVSCADCREGHRDKFPLLCVTQAFLHNLA